MSLTRSVLVSHRVQWLTSNPHRQSELKHRFFACFSTTSSIRFTIPTPSNNPYGGTRPSSEKEGPTHSTSSETLVAPASEELHIPSEFHTKETHPPNFAYRIGPNGRPKTNKGDGIGSTTTALPIRFHSQRHAQSAAKEFSHSALSSEKKDETLAHSPHHRREGHVALSQDHRLRRSTDLSIDFTQHGKNIDSRSSCLYSGRNRDLVPSFSNLFSSDISSDDADGPLDNQIDSAEQGSIHTIQPENGAGTAAEDWLVPLSMYNERYKPNHLKTLDIANTVEADATSEEPTIAQLAVRIYEVLNTLSDHPEFQNVERLPQPPAKNRDYLLEAGEAAYDWRPPLEILLSNSEPMSDAENHRLKASLEKLRELKNSHTPVLDKRRYDVDHPPEWTVKSFAQYIYDLVHLTPRREKPLYTRRGSRPPHPTIDPIKTRLLNTIADPSSRTFLSYEAFHQAIRYLQHHGYVRDSTRLMSFMAEIGLEPTVETYNCLFYEISKRKNLVVFGATLRKMVRKGVKPDAYTWAHFALCLDSLVARNIVIEQMRKLQFFQSQPLVKWIVLHTVGPELHEHLTSGGKFADFCKQLDERWGTRWVGSAVINVMLQRVGSHGQFLDVIQCMLILSAHRHMQPDEWTLIKILQICHGFGRPQAAIAILGLFHKTFNVLPNEYVMHKLLSIFYIHGYTNCCRVVWQVACVRGLVGYKIHRTMFNALGMPPHTVAEPFKDRFTRFRSFGCKIIAGRFFQFNWAQFWEDWLKHGDPIIRERLLSTTAQAVILSDKQAYMQYFFSGDFSDELIRAYDKDLEWQNRPEVLAGDIKWMAENATNIPLGHTLSNSERPYVPEKKM